MINEEIVRAWKDAEYRQRLSAKEQALLPGHPAGVIELTDEELSQVAGAISEEDYFTYANQCLTFIHMCPVTAG